MRKSAWPMSEGDIAVKAHRQYTDEQIKRDPRFARDLEEAKVQVRIVMIARLREKRGLSQRDLAKIVGVKQPQIARLEKGDHLPTLETLLRLEEGLSLSS